MKSDLVKLVATYIVGTGPVGVPSSELWMAVDPNMSDLSTHIAMLGALEEKGILTVKGHFVSLTEKGQSMLAKIVQLYKIKV